jgi:predicted nuclease of predicted toxin-antitoxin system
MKVLIDMNLSPRWVEVLERHGHEALHWSSIGDPRATDRRIMDWARNNGFVVFTHDLDFGVILAVTQASGPSVVQVRAQDVTPDHLGDLVLSALERHADVIEAGALIVLDEARARLRILPIV